MAVNLDDPAWLYQATCTHGALLYVGIAYDVPRRLGQHRATKSWWPEVDAVVALHYPTRRTAAAVESRIIAGVHPVYNIAGKPAHRPDGARGGWVLYDPRGNVLDRADA